LANDIVGSSPTSGNVILSMVISALCSPVPLMLALTFTGNTNGIHSLNSSSASPLGVTNCDLTSMSCPLPVGFAPPP
jgi:hypothetical protein